MNSFTKLLDGTWGARVASPTAQPGDAVTITTRAGASKQVTLGEFVADDGYGRIFKIAARPAQAEMAVGNLTGILAMFDRAKQHLKHPAIVLDGFRVNVAGQRARQPGSLTVTSVEKGYDGKRAWFGRVTLAGTFEPGRDAPAGLGEKLARFAADPVTVAGEYGRLHGVCCFCHRPLQDERSTAVGYGPICADHFGLPWGARPEAEAPDDTANLDDDEMGINRPQPGSTAWGTARSRARARMRAYNHQENDPLDHDYSMND